METAGQVLQDKAALVVGGSRGIGRAVAVRLAQAGAQVAVTARKMPDLEAAAREIEALGSPAFPIAANARHRQELEALPDKVLERFGRLDIVVNNVGTNVTFGPIMDVDEAAWDVVMNTNVKVAFLLTRAAARVMKERGGGSIVHISSLAGIRHGRGLGMYSVSKAALNMLTQVMAGELGPHNIRVNAVAPGVVKTAFSKMLWDTPEILQRTLQETALGRIARPKEVAEAVLFLASDASSYVTGQVLILDGGYAGSL